MVSSDACIVRIDLFHMSFTRITGDVLATWVRARGFFAVCGLVKKDRSASEDGKITYTFIAVDGREYPLRMADNMIQFPESMQVECEIIGNKQMNGQALIVQAAFPLGSVSAQQWEVLHGQIGSARLSRTWQT
jgi:hypothetical protein